MIRHLVFFTAKDPADLDLMHRTFATLADIPGVRGFEVGVNTRRDERTDDEPDLVVHAVLDDETALAAYKAHPTYQASIDVVRPLRDVRIAVDYEVDAPAPPPPSSPPRVS